MSKRKTDRHSPRDWGRIRKLPSGRYQASYPDADGKLRNGPQTFDTRKAAAGWLDAKHADLTRGTWRDPDAGAVTFAEYVRQWMTDADLASRTREEYQRIIDRALLPAFGDWQLRQISVPAVQAWYRKLDRSTPSQRAHTYGLLRTILKAAEADDLIAKNPARIKSAGQSPRARKRQIASFGQIKTITGAMPPRFRLMITLGIWTQLRFGEITELRRADIDLDAAEIHITRAVARLKGRKEVKGPKSDAGVRDVPIPPDMIPMIEQHLAEHTRPEPDALLFPASTDGNRHLAPATFQRHYYRARDKAGRPDLRFHDMRHTGATMTAWTGASIAEIMARGGWSSPQAAMRYQHAAQHRGHEIAAQLSGLMTGEVTPLRRAG